MINSGSLAVTVFEPCAFADVVASSIAAKSVKDLNFLYMLFSCVINRHWLQNDGLMIVAYTKKERGAILLLLVPRSKSSRIALKVETSNVESPT